MRIIYLIVFMVLFCASGNLDSLKRISIEMENKYGLFAAILMDFNNGEKVFTYHEEFINEYYSIGSLIKPFTYLAVLKNSEIDPEKKYFCKGFKDFSLEKICWINVGHGSVNLINAFAHSCNSYFYDEVVKGKLKREYFINVLKDFQLDFLFKPYALSDENFYRSAIGLDGYLLATPASVIKAYSLIFGGRLYSDNHQVIYNSIYEKYSESWIENIKEGMRGSYLYGTSLPVYKEIKIGNLAGKTGTGMGGKKGENSRSTTGWIILFYPVNKPKYSLLVFTEKGRGGKEAADIAAQLIKQVVIKN